MSLIKDSFEYLFIKKTAKGWDSYSNNYMGCQINTLALFLPRVEHFVTNLSLSNTFYRLK